MAPSLRFVIVVGGCVGVPVLFSGCLRDDVFPEPYGWRGGPLVSGQGDHTASVTVPAEAHRIRFRYEATIGGAPLLGGTSGAELRLRDPSGRVHSYNLTATGGTQDTFGGPVGGAWGLTHSDRLGGSTFRVRFEFYQPQYEDWAWWQVWRT